MRPIEIYDTVIVNYELGHVNDIFIRNGTEYASVTLEKGQNTVTALRNVTHVRDFLFMARKANLDKCPYCNGEGRVDPIENPPYRCDYCNGEGYTVSA